MCRRKEEYKQHMTNVRIVRLKRRNIEIRILVKRKKLTGNIDKET